MEECRFKRPTSVYWRGMQGFIERTSRVGYGHPKRVKVPRTTVRYSTRTYSTPGPQLPTPPPSPVEAPRHSFGRPSFYRRRSSPREPYARCHIDLLSLFVSLSIALFLSVQTVSQSADFAQAKKAGTLSDKILDFREIASHCANKIHQRFENNLPRAN